MKILIYSSKKFENSFLTEANTGGHQMDFVIEPLSLESVSLASGYDCISIFSADDASAPVIRELSKQGVNFIAIRAAGYDNVDLEAANENNITVANVPEYSPYAIAEHAVALMLALNRKLIQANEEVHRNNFLLDELIGFDLNKKTVGIVGTGRIGSVLAKIMHGFGCSVLACDVKKNQQLEKLYNVNYVNISELCSQSDIISLNVPSTKETKHLINETLIRLMKRGVMLINTSRGALVKTEDIISYLENGHIGYYGMDVYEKEKGIFFFDHRGETLNDPLLEKLQGFNNVLITPHQAFATKEALNNIANTTFLNIDCWSQNQRSGNELTGVTTNEDVLDEVSAK